MPPSLDKSRLGAPPPKCKAILLCDLKIIEAGTGKVSIIGVFDSFTPRKVPGKIDPFTVFLQLTDGVGEYEVTIEVQDLLEDRVVVRMPAVAVQWRDRLTKMNLYVPVPSLPIEHEGRYDVVAFADGVEIDRQRFLVYQNQ